MLGEDAADSGAEAFSVCCACSVVRLESLSPGLAGDRDRRASGGWRLVCLAYDRRRNAQG
jgi:hypothetical protein